MADQGWCGSVAIAIVTYGGGMVWQNKVGVVLWPQPWWNVGMLEYQMDHNSSTCYSQDIDVGTGCPTYLVTLGFWRF